MLFESKAWRLSKLLLFFISTAKIEGTMYSWGRIGTPRSIVNTPRGSQVVFMGLIIFHLEVAILLIHRISCSIVAVHGIGGHPLNTWTWNQKSTTPKASFKPELRLSPIKSEGPTKILWLQELLPFDLPTARVMTFEYDTQTSFSAVTHITEVSKSLLNCLMEKRKKDFVG